MFRSFRRAASLLLLCTPMLFLGCVTIEKKAALLEGTLACSSSQTIWETTGADNCTIKLTVTGNADCKCLLEGDEDNISSDGKAKSVSKTGKSAKAICRGTKGEGCAYKVTDIQCAPGKVETTTVDEGTYVGRK